MPNQTIVADISHEFVNSTNTLPVLRNVSFGVSDKEVIALLGPSGCGKSTLLRIIAGLLPPSSGETSINGKTVEYARKNKWIGFAFQEPGLLEWRTVRENILLPAEIGFTGKIDKIYIQHRLRELLKLMRLSSFAHFYPANLSGGMKQRVSLARAIFFEPKILLLDEPLGALDLLTRTYLMEELSKLIALMKTPTIIVTHSVEEAVFLATKILVLSQAPAHVVETIDVHFTIPRTLNLMDGSEYQQLVSHCRNILFNEWRDK